VQIQTLESTKTALERQARNVAACNVGTCSVQGCSAQQTTAVVAAVVGAAASERDAERRRGKVAGNASVPIKWSAGLCATLLAARMRARTLAHGPMQTRSHSRT
jgi:hypothetical protein